MRTATLLSLLIGISPLAAVGADFDGSKPLICAQTSAQECYSGERCRSVSAEDTGIPQFLRVDVRKREITDPNSGEASEIVTVTEIDIADDHEEVLSDLLILQGTEQGLGWSLSIARETGKMVLTAAGEAAGVVAFGACTLD